MNYSAIYDCLIANAILRSTTLEYGEKHHIVPKSLGGSNEKNNIVVLLGREHFVAHMLLAKIYGKGMWQAARMMQNKSKVQDGRVTNSRLYEMARREWAKYASTQIRPKHVIDAIRSARTGSKASDATKAKMSAIRKGRLRAGNPQNWKHSAEAKAKMSESKKGKVNHMSLDAHKQRMRGDSNPMKLPENQLKISEAKKLYWAKIRQQKTSLENKNVSR